ncbi:MAG: YkvA family protein [Gemmatimonadota bacterium]|nr:YkvA family protein [Gemmatimonadota bacterium]
MATTTGRQTRRKTAGASASASRPRAAEATPRTGAKRTVIYYMKQLPAYMRLLGGLLIDRRVSAVDKLLVAGAMAYIAMPIDIIPDFIPFLGEVDDVFLLVLALQRLIANSGRTVLMAHWNGAIEDLADLNLEAVLAAAAFFLPKGIRRRLKVIGRG